MLVLHKKTMFLLIASTFKNNTSLVSYDYLVRTQRFPHLVEYGISSVMRVLPYATILFGSKILPVMVNFINSLRLFLNSLQV